MRRRLLFLFLFFAGLISASVIFHYAYHETNLFEYDVLISFLLAAAYFFIYVLLLSFVAGLTHRHNL